MRSMLSMRTVYLLMLMVATSASEAQTLPLGSAVKTPAVVFVKGATRSMGIRVESHEPLTDTARLVTRARALLGADSARAQMLHANVISVLFEYTGNQIAVAGVTHPDAWAVTFVHGPHGWQRQAPPPKRTITLDVVPGKPHP